MLLELNTLTIHENFFKAVPKIFCLWGNKSVFLIFKSTVKENKVYSETEGVL